MITSDAELQNNTHPAQEQGGAPVLDGQVEHTERPNVNAMREVIEAQAEFEVGKPIEEKAEEVQAEEKAVTVEKGSGTQIIINIAGKKKAMSFTTPEAAKAFIKGASEKFGSKFQVVAAEHCHGKLCSTTRESHCACKCEKCKPYPKSEKKEEKVADMNKEKEAGFNFFFPGQVLSEINPELLHDIVDYPSDPHADTNGLEAQLDNALDVGAISAVSTDPVGGLIGNDAKTSPMRKEDEVRGPAFMEQFYSNYDQAPAVSVLAKKAAAGEEKEQFSLFLKRVMGEVVATFLAAFKATSKMPMNQVPGVGKVLLSSIEQPVTSTFNTVDCGSRVKYLMDKMADNEIQECLNEAYAQGAVWHENPKGGFVYEVFVRAENIDTDSMELTYKFVTGTKDSE